MSVRILHLRATDFVGGPERQLLGYASSGAPGVEVLLGTFVGGQDGRAFAEAARQQGVCCLEFPAAAREAVAGLKLAIREHDIALLCTHGYKPAVLGLVAARQCGIPVACFLRGWTGQDWKVRQYERLERLAFRFADVTVCVSETETARLGRSSRRPVRTVINATEVRSVPAEDRARMGRELRQRFQFPADARVILSAGRLSPEKGTDVFVRAAAALHSRFPEARFIVFGDGTERECLQKLAVEAGLQEVLRFAGFVPDFSNLLPGTDLLVNPSHSEQMPNVVLEAMACGVPVIATAVGGVPEIAGPQSAVQLVPPGDPGAIVEAASGLLADPAKLSHLGEAGRERLRSAFSPQKQADQLRALYRELIPSLHAGSDALVDGEPARPFISVVIPVRNEERYLGSVLDGLLAQDYPRDRFEILVADGASSDSTPALVTRYAERAPQPGIKLLANPARLSSAGRNVGARASRGDVVLFIDGHCRIPSPRLLSDSARLLRETGADCLCRPQPLRLAHTTFQRAVTAARATWLGHGRDSLIYSDSARGFVDPTSSGACYRRGVFQKIGYYDEQFDACEDVEFNHRVKAAGLRSYTDPCLTVEYEPRQSLGALFRQMMRYGRGRLRLARKHPSALSIAQMVPALLLAGVVCGAVLAAGGVLRQLYLAAVVAYLGLVFLVSLSLLRKGPAVALLSPLVLVTVHMGLGAGFWSELLSQLLRPRSWNMEIAAEQPSHEAGGAAPKRSAGAGA